MKKAPADAPAEGKVAVEGAVEERAVEERAVEEVSAAEVFSFKLACFVNNGVITLTTSSDASV